METMNDTILSEAGLLLENDKATEQMQKSISKFASLLICPLCNKVRCKWSFDTVYRPSGGANNLYCALCSPIAVPQKMNGA